MGGVIRGIPEQMGALVILVDHDMSLVSACCEVTAVLDFGKLIAAGPPADVLRADQVTRAFLGTGDEKATLGARPRHSRKPPTRPPPEPAPRCGWKGSASPA